MLLRGVSLLCYIEEKLTCKTFSDELPGTNSGEIVMEAYNETRDCEKLEAAHRGSATLVPLISDSFVFLR